MPTGEILVSTAIAAVLLAGCGPGTPSESPEHVSSPALAPTTTATAVTALPAATLATTEPSPASSQAGQAIQAGGVTLTLPGEFVVDEPADEGIGERPEVPLITAMSTVAETSVASFRLGRLKEGWINGDGAQVGIDVVNDYYAPLLGDIGILGTSDRLIEVDGAPAHERVMISKQASDGSLIVVDMIVVLRAEDAWYMELGRSFLTSDEVPDGVFLPEMGEIAASITLP